eukprot:evm.model.scf_418.5 EVM.evm.TU.scf_418.5   scf_418:30292-31068(-)
MLKASGRMVSACGNTTCWRRTLPFMQAHRPRAPSSPPRQPSSSSAFLGSRAPLMPRRAIPGIAHSRSRGAVQIRAAIFGVGAPEAIVVVVVAVLVFGPKGLAQAAKSLGSALRSFQPTIRELAEVSTDLKSTLEQEMGLDELRDDIRAIRSPLAAQPRSPSSQVTQQLEAGKEPSDDSNGSEQETGVVDGVDADIDEMRAESARLAWGGRPPAAASDGDALSGASVAELEAELARRRAQGIAEVEAELARRKAQGGDG